MDWRRGCFLVWLAGCGTETGNPDLLFLSYNAWTSDPEAVSLQPQQAQSVALSVWLRLGPIRLEGDCQDEPVLSTHDALGFADHAEPGAASQELEVPTETTCRVETSFEQGQAPGEPEPVAGTSVALLGELADGRAFQVLIREPVPVELQLEDEPVPADGGWLMSFDVATWLDPSALAALPGDPVVVSADDNADVYADVLARLAPGVQLHHDEDGDGEVDPGERRLDR
jgi:hypothetical protein